MSYSISDYEQDIERWSAFSKELRELYPDACYLDDEWFSTSLTLDECDVVKLKPGADGPMIVVRLGKQLPSGCIVWMLYYSGAAPKLMIGKSVSAVDAVLFDAILLWAKAKG